MNKKYEKNSIKFGEWYLDILANTRTIKLVDSLTLSTDNLFIWNHIKIQVEDTSFEQYQSDGLPLAYANWIFHWNIKVNIAFVHVLRIAFPDISLTMLVLILIWF